MQNIVCFWQTGSLTASWHTGAVEQSECKMVLAGMVRGGSHKGAGAGNVGAVMDLPDSVLGPISTTAKPRPAKPTTFWARERNQQW